MHSSDSKKVCYFLFSRLLRSAVNGTDCPSLFLACMVVICRPLYLLASSLCLISNLWKEQKICLAWG